jgi:DNA-binding Lrp family transcriptional regulator
MDTYSLAAAARLLGTSPPRVRRAVDRLELAGGRDSAGVFHLTKGEVGELSRELGVTPPVPGLSRTETQVLAALSRSPRGLASVRETARRAGVSPTAAGRALALLSAKGTITQSPMMLAKGRASQTTVYQVRFGTAEWAALAPAVAKVRLPVHTGSHRVKRVPPHLRHLFWNTAPAQLDVATSAPYIARRLIQADDPDGLAWGAASLPASAWEHAATTRGLDPAHRALARNLARHTHAAG